MRKIKYETVGSISNELNFPHVKATEEVPNYSFGVVDLVSKTFSKADSTTKIGVDVGFIDVTEVGDEVKIIEGDEVNFKAFRALDGRVIEFTEDCITYGGAVADYDAIVPGTTLLAVGEDFNAEVITSSAGYAIYMKVINKFMLGSKAVKAQVVVV